MHVRVFALPEWRVDRERQHVRHVFTQAVEDVDGLPTALHGVVDVYRERVVAPDQPPQLRLQALVMGLVDDLLLPPVAYGVRPAGAKDPAKTLGLPEQHAPARDEVHRTTPEGSSWTPVLDSISQSMSSPEKQVLGL